MKTLYSFLYRKMGRSCDALCQIIMGESTTTELEVGTIRITGLLVTLIHQVPTIGQAKLE